ncbi:MAG: hypothetical protein ACRDQA_19940 [Nocardioidaceae bacterium]
MTETVPNVQLRAWRNAQNLTRWEMARDINDTGYELNEPVQCNEERIRRWETGEVLWPAAPYRRTLEKLTGQRADDLGFVPPGRRQTEQQALAGRIVTPDAMGAEAELFDTLELARMVEVSDSGQARSRRSRRPRACSAAPTHRFPPHSFATGQRNDSST